MRFILAGKIVPVYYRKKNFLSKNKQNPRKGKVGILSFPFTKRNKMFQASMWSKRFPQINERLYVEPILTLTSSTNAKVFHMRGPNALQLPLKVTTIPNEIHEYVGIISFAEKTISVFHHFVFVDVDISFSEDLLIGLLWYDLEFLENVQWSLEPTMKYMLWELGPLEWASQLHQLQKSA